MSKDIVLGGLIGSWSAVAACELFLGGANMRSISWGIIWTVAAAYVYLKDYRDAN